MRRRPFRDRFREQAAQQRAIHLNHVRKIEIEHVTDRLFYDRMIAPNVKNAVATQEIEVGGVIHVVEIGAFCSRVDFVETDDPLRSDKRTVDVSLVQLVIFAQTRGDHFFQVKRHSKASAISTRNATFTVPNPDTPGERPSLSWSFPVNVVPAAWPAIETTQKFSVNRCAGVLLQRRAAISARRDEPCPPPNPLPHVREQFARKPNIQVPPKLLQLSGRHSAHLRRLRSPKRSSHPGYCAPQSSTSSILATKSPGRQRKPHVLAAPVAIAVLRPGRKRPL